MTLNNFEATVPATTLKSGREAFSRERIQDLTEARTGRWTAAIWSKKYLELSVDLKGNTITGASCECKPSGGETYCAHIVAMLYAIRYEKGLIPEREVSLGSDPGALGGKWASESDKDAMARYAKLIRDPFNQARDITGHIYRDQTNKVMRVPTRLLDEARKAFEDGNPNEAVNITLAVIETTTYCSLMLEHGDSSMMDIYYIGFELLGEILAQSPSNELRNRLYEHGVSGGIEMKDSIDPYHTFWLEFLIEHRLYPKQDNRLSELIQMLATRAKRHRNPNVQRELEEIKARYVQTLGTEPKTSAATVVRTTQANAPAASPAQTQKPAPKAPAPQPEFQKKPDSPALVTALEAARKEGNKKRIEMYQQCILSERRSRNDKLGVREIALELFQNNPTEDYLGFIKETYTQLQWEQEGKEYTERLKKTKAKNS